MTACSSLGRCILRFYERADPLIDVLKSLMYSSHVTVVGDGVARHDCSIVSDRTTHLSVGSIVNSKLGCDGWQRE